MADVPVPGLSPTLMAHAATALGVQVHSAAPLGGGRNSRAFRLTTNAGPWVLKQYHDPARLENEFAALTFLSANAPGRTPDPLFHDREHGFALYQWMDGESVTAANVTDRDLDDCLALMRDLLGLRQAPGADAFGPAAEAFFTPSGVLGNIRDRLERLMAREREEGSNKEMDAALDAFLERDFAPELARLGDRARKHVDDTPLPPAARILSPSDFGFHNALRTPRGMVFFDFEYFGWDDPAKLAADFLLHPGMDISEPMRLRFAADAAALTGDTGARLAALLPLFGCKWCMILLNEFLRGHRERRRFAGEDRERGALLAAQLDKARAMLDTARRWAEAPPKPPKQAITGD